MQILFKVAQFWMPFNKQISLDKSQPESLRKEMQVQLAIPLKHKQVEVIDMDTSDDAPL